MIKVSVYSVLTSMGTLYGLYNVNTDQILQCGVARWKSRKGAENFAKKNGFDLV